VYRYFSADNHWDPMWLPRGVWQDRLPQRLREAGPKIVESDRGTYWEWEGTLHRPAADGRDNAKYRAMLVDRGVPAPEGSLPPTDPALLLEFLNRSSIAAALFFTAPVKWRVKDPALNVAMHRAYNDFVRERVGAAGDRLIVLPIVPVNAPEAAVAEARHAIELGFRAIEVPIYDMELPVYEPGWDPLWALLAEAGVVLCVHIGDRSLPAPAIRNAQAAHFVVSPYAGALPVAQMLMGGMFERHPTLRMCVGETRCGWLPFYMSWMDRQVRNRPLDPNVTLSMLPSEYARRNLIFTFEEDPVGARLCGLDWSGQAAYTVWGGDYPHPSGLWGDGVDAAMDAMFAEVDPAVRDYVVRDHALAFFTGVSSVAAVR
jgi:predicted TIM-barrel fold metal-dependent hydrolase